MQGLKNNKQSYEIHAGTSEVTVELILIEQVHRQLSLNIVFFRHLLQVWYYTVTQKQRI